MGKKTYHAFTPEDVETGRRGDQELVGLDNFASRVQTLTGDVKDIERLVEQLDTQYTTAGLECSNEQDRAEHKERLKTFTQDIHARLQIANRKHAELQAHLERELRSSNPNDFSRKSSLQNSMDMLARALQGVFDKLRQFQNHCKQEEKQMVQTQLQDILNRSPSDDEVDRVLAAGDRQAILATMMRDRGTAALQGVLQQLDARLEGTESIQREVDAIVELMKELQANVQSQSAAIRRIDDDLARTQLDTERAVKDMGNAAGYKRKAMTIKASIISVVLFTILAVIAIVLIVTLGQK